MRGRLIITIMLTLAQNVRYRQKSDSEGGGAAGPELNLREHPINFPSKITRHEW